MYWVVPFGNLRINLYVPIPVAYRSLSRPSSPLRAKASAIRPYLLSRISYVYLNSTLSQHVNELVSPLSLLDSPSGNLLTLARVDDCPLKGNRVIRIPCVLTNQFLFYIILNLSLRNLISFIPQFTL